MSQTLVYREVLARGRRTFELFEDRLVMHVKYPNQKSETTYTLSELQPIPLSQKTRQPTIYLGLIMIAAPWVYLGLRWIFARVVPVGDAFVVAFSLNFVGAVVSLYSLRKIEFAGFMSRDGAIAFDIGDSGPDRDQFRKFVETTTQHITANQSGA